MSREEEESSCAEEVHPKQREPTAQGGVLWGRAWCVLRTGRIQARGGGRGQVK